MHNADLVAAGIGVIGLSFAWSGGKHVLLGRQSRKWLSVEGRVLSSETKVVRDRQGHGYARACVRYRYIVGHERIGERISADAEYTTSDSDRELQWVLRYPRGSACRVYYSPDDPDEAVLERGEGNVSVLFLLVGVVLLSGVLLHFLPAPGR